MSQIVNIWTNIPLNVHPYFLSFLLCCILTTIHPYILSLFNARNAKKERKESRKRIFMCFMEYGKCNLKSIFFLLLDGIDRKEKLSSHLTDNFNECVYVKRNSRGYKQMFAKIKFIIFSNPWNCCVHDIAWNLESIAEDDIITHEKKK